RTEPWARGWREALRRRRTQPGASVRPGATRRRRTEGGRRAEVRLRPHEDGGCFPEGLRGGAGRWGGWMSWTRSGCSSGRRGWRGGGPGRAAGGAGGGRGVAVTDQEVCRGLDGLGLWLERQGQGDAAVVVAGEAVGRLRRIAAEEPGLRAVLAAAAGLVSRVH